MEPRPVRAGDNTEESSSEEEESEGDCGNVPIGGGGDGVRGQCSQDGHHCKSKGVNGNGTVKVRWY